MIDQMLFLYCPTCARQCLAEAPPCPDGHGADCPERACVECGTALLVDTPLADAVSAGVDGSAAAHAHRPAA